MSDQREEIIRQILTIDKRIYQYLQVPRMPDWVGVELTMPQLKVLFLAGGPRPLPTSHVARALGMTVSTATGVVDRLVAQGLIRRLEEPADRRVVLLQASPEGASLLERLTMAGLGHFRDILDQLSKEELQLVARALDLLHSAAMSLGQAAEPPATRPEPSALRVKQETGTPGLTSSSK